MFTNNRNDYRWEPEFRDKRSDYYRKFAGLVSQLSPSLNFYTDSWGNSSFPWRISADGRWALISADGRVLVQESNIPDKDVMQDILKRNGINSPVDFYREYIMDKGSTPGIGLALAHEIILQNSRAQANQNPVPLEASQDEYTWGEAVRLLRGVLNSPDVLLNFYFYLPNADAAKQSPSMKSLSKSCLSSIESSLERKPSLTLLWGLWFFWRSIEDSERPLEPLVERIKYSPLSQTKTLPEFVLDGYYQECIKNENWLKVIELLESVWKREFLRYNEALYESDELYKMQRDNILRDLADRVVIPLIEAYINDDRPQKANEKFNAWLDSGGGFTDISKIVELAKSKGHESLARGWENKVRR